MVTRAQPNAFFAKAPVQRGGRLTNVSWSAPSAMSYEEWIFHGRRLGAIGRGVGWWIGDWLRFGNARYGEKYVRAARITGYDVQTLMNMVYVASSVEPSRRREGLSWSHHAEVAALPPEEQNRWLDRVEEERLSVRDLRLSLRDARRREAIEKGAQEGAPDHATICPTCGHELEPVNGRSRGGRRQNGSHVRSAEPVLQHG